jgi:hypothetical protein
MTMSRGMRTAVIFAGLAVGVATTAWAGGPTPAPVRPPLSSGDVHVSAIAFSLERNMTGVAVLVPGPNLATAIQNAYNQAVATCRANGGGQDCGPVAYGAQGDCSVLLYDPAPRLNRPRGVYQGASGQTIEEAVNRARQAVPDINPALPPREQICA